jgi:hypothetical protein
MFDLFYKRKIFCISNFILHVMREVNIFYKAKNLPLVKYKFEKVQIIDHIDNISNNNKLKYH